MDGRLEVKDAVRLAKQHIADLFADEKIADLGLEEVVYNDEEKSWEITVGFSRPWQKFSAVDAVTQGYTYLRGNPNAAREYKVVKIREDDSRVTAVKIREVG
jgi:hypothetical protein